MIICCSFKTFYVETIHQPGSNLRGEGGPRLKTMLYAKCYHKNQYGYRSHKCSNKHLKNTKLYSIEFLRTEMTSDPQTEIETTSRQASILCDSLRI